MAERQTFTVGNRTYKLISFLKEGEDYVSGQVMLKRSKKLNANLGEEDGQIILKHRDKIRQKYRKFCLVFTTWSFPGIPENVVILYWDYNGCQCVPCYFYNYSWGDDTRLVRRIA